VALIDKDKITDIHAKRVITRSTEKTDHALEQTDRDIRSVCLDRGVTPDNIPVDVNDFATSDILISYGEARLTLHLLEANLEGVAIEDALKDKITYWNEQAKSEEKKITLRTIMVNTENRQSKRVAAIPMW